METAAAGNGNMIFMIMIVFVIIIMIWSGKGQKKREAEHRKQVDLLQKGDEVVISGGIVGTVVGFKDNALEVKLAENVKVTVLKSAIVGFLNKMTAVQQGDSK